MKKFTKLSLIAAAALTLAAPVFAQQAADPQSVEKDVALLRQDVRQQKRQIVAANMPLTTEESAKFWPIYDKYTAELVEINNKKYAILKQYATSFDTLTDAQYNQMCKDWIQVDE